MFKRANCTPAHWAVSTDVRINGRVVEVDTECSIKNERGRFRFIREVTDTKTGAVWLDFIGGAKGCPMFRSFHADRVKTVHWKNRTRENADD